MQHIALPVAASLISLAFSMSTMDKWLAHRRRQELMWTISLAFFCLASAGLTAGSAIGWNGFIFRTFYFFGAVATVPFLALGTIYLFRGPRQGDRATLFVLLILAFGAGVIVTTPFRSSLPADRLVQGSHVFGPLPRVLAALCSGIGSLVVIGGAIWSCFVRRLRRRVVGNGLIALGTAVTGMSGLLNSVMNEMDAFSVSMVVGITLLFTGFLVISAGPAQTLPESSISTAPSGRNPSSRGPTFR